MRWAVLLILASCGPEPVECTPLPIYGISCETHPELCDLPSSTIYATSNPRAYHLVFLPEGFTDAELPAFHRHVQKLARDLRNDAGGIVDLAPDMFDMHVVDVPSRTSLLANGERYDTALGGCLSEDEFRDDPDGRVDASRARLAAANAPGADAVIVIFANGDPHANTLNGIVILSIDDNAKTLTHELGHALFALGDEYTETPACYYEERFPYETGPSDMLGTANLTLDPYGRKWRRSWAGAIEGGRRYGDCIYHPTDECRMLDSQGDAFCPVCLAEIGLRIALRRDPNLDDGPPICEIAMRDDPMDLKAQVSFEVRLFDRTGPIHVWVALDHVVLWETSYSSGASTYQVTNLPVRPGNHAIMAECTDRLGSTSRARMEAFAH
ncbi:MAG: M64 family metallopeptidase [Kofleriaceae bacterium]